MGLLVGPQARCGKSGRYQFFFGTGSDCIHSFNFYLYVLGDLACKMRIRQTYKSTTLLHVALYCTFRLNEL